MGILMWPSLVPCHSSFFLLLSFLHLWGFVALTTHIHSFIPSHFLGIRIISSEGTHPRSNNNPHIVESPLLSLFFPSLSLSFLNRYDSVTVMFSGIVGFAKYCAENSDAEGAMKIVTMLNDLYTSFDELTDPSRNPNIYKVSRTDSLPFLCRYHFFSVYSYPLFGWMVGWAAFLLLHLHLLYLEPLRLWTRENNR